MLDPKGRVILVSGASRGIGRAVSEKLHAQGYALSLGVRDPRKAAAALSGLAGDRVHIARFIAEDWASHADWVAEAADRFGRIDGLVNNAGTNSQMTLRAPDEAELDRVWAVNCKAPLNLIHHALPHLEASGAGRIINIASLSGKRVRNDRVAYNMSKFALMALTHSARRIGWDRGVRATAICPSFVSTDMSIAASFPFGQMTTPQSVADLVATALALPNNAAIAEVLVNCRLEDTL
jgi:NAD(P)-dependent dehydrogenase (short-subunit alcohol dehydrogenase family)